MTPQRETLTDRLRAVLAETGSIPVVVGLCGTGRTTALNRVQQELGPQASQYIDVERITTTPERFFTAITAGSPFVGPAVTPSSARQAFDATLAFLRDARCADGAPATFLLDEVLELRTFESFPGLRHAVPDLLRALAASGNRFVLASRYIARTRRVLADAPPSFVVIDAPPLEAGDIARMISGDGNVGAPTATPPAPDGVAQLVQRLSGGHAAYARALVDAIRRAVPDGGMDPVAALAGLLEPGHRLAHICRSCYELRLHRARGYGALKAILDILAEQEPLTLTEISRKLHRTPGSTKDYLSWLEDVDLVSVRRKRYRFRDPVLRLWVRLHCRPVPPTPDDVAREIGQYAASLVPDAPQPGC